MLSDVRVVEKEREKARSMSDGRKARAVGRVVSRSRAAAAAAAVVAPPLVALLSAQHEALTCRRLATPIWWSEEKGASSRLVVARAHDVGSWRHPARHGVVPALRWARLAGSVEATQQESQPERRARPVGRQGQGARARRWRAGGAGRRAGARPGRGPRRRWRG